LIAFLRATFSTMTRTNHPAAVLFDRDGTLVVDVPYCTDPDQVRPMPGARDALGAVRAAGLPVGVVTNQSGIGRGLISTAAHAAVTSRVEELLGPFDVWRYCPHVPEDGCACRKPRPGMLLDAARALGVAPHEVAYVGDIGSDVDAARAAGALPVLVPTPVTLSSEIESAPVVCADLTEAIAHLLGPR
jgi:HAD superfamily hydrolase (TIGR01662 family)